MKKTFEKKQPNEIDQLCSTVRDLVSEKKYDESIEMICHAMEKYPHAPQPHNLMGVVLEKIGDHRAAMKHFRASWALDPTYLPAEHNLNTYGTFFSKGTCAFDESDINNPDDDYREIVYDERGVGQVLSKTISNFDEDGIIRITRR